MIVSPLSSRTVTPAPPASAAAAACPIPPTPAELVEAAFWAELGRPANDAERPGWRQYARALREAGKSDDEVREGVAAQLRLTPEWKRKHPGPMPRPIWDMVESGFWSELGHPSDPWGRAKLMRLAGDLRERGIGDDRIRAALVAAIRETPEYLWKYPAPMPHPLPDLVESAYWSELGRMAGDAGQAWLMPLARRLRYEGRRDEEVRAAVVAELQKTPEYLKRYPPAPPPLSRHLVESAYWSELGRATDPAGRATWVRAVDGWRAQGMPEDEVRARLVIELRKSPEYKQKHGCG